jgi:hypothetical protein
MRLLCVQRTSVRFAVVVVLRMFARAVIRRALAVPAVVGLIQISIQRSCFMSEPKPYYVYDVIAARPLGVADELIAIAADADAVRQALVAFQDREFGADLLRLVNALSSLDDCGPDSSGDWYCWYASAEIERLASEAEALLVKERDSGQ